MATFGSAGSINYPDKKALSEGHSMRSTCGSTRHSSLGDHKSLEAEALAEVRASGKAGWASREPQRGGRVGATDWGATLPFMQGSGLSQNTEGWRAGLPVGVEAGWVQLLARDPVKTQGFQSPRLEWGFLPWGQARREGGGNDRCLH